MAKGEIVEHDASDSDDTMNASDDDVSERDSADEFEYPDDEHKNTAEVNRRVKINIKDGHDHSGPGMTFELKYRDKFKNAFDQFKAASCKDCRPVDKIRFKTTNKEVSEKSTPKRLDLWHNTTTEIRAHSNTPGLQCANCQRVGYPKTDGAITATPVDKHPPSNILRLPVSTASAPITLIVKDQTGFQTSVKMRNTARFENLMKTYAERAKRDLETLRFLWDGERLAKQETPEKLELVDNDVIEVFVEQIGG